MKQISKMVAVSAAAPSTFTLFAVAAPAVYADDYCITSAAQAAAWLRLSQHGGMPGSIRRHRRHLCGQALVPESQQCPSLSARPLQSNCRGRVH